MARNPLVIARALLLLPAILVGKPSFAQDASVVPSAGAAVLDAPNGDTIATIRSVATAVVLEESGDWARVRFEGWTPIGTAPSDSAPPSGAIGLAELRADPERYQGARVRWRVQYVALQRADHLRSDMEPGSHYLLVRDPGGEPGFVYVLVPEASIAAVEHLAPLQRIEIVAVVRTGSSPLTGHPILDLVEIRGSQER